MLMSSFTHISYGIKKYIKNFWQQIFGSNLYGKFLGEIPDHCNSDSKRLSQAASFLCEISSESGQAPGIVSQRPNTSCKGSKILCQRPNTSRQGSKILCQRPNTSCKGSYTSCKGSKILRK